MSQNTPTIPYRPDIDGLRAVAVLPVVLYHAGLGCPGGFVGVDVFFVISGYLIGSLVLSEIRSGTFRMVGFWERRVRRIFPALAVVVFSTFAVSAFLMVPQHLEELGKSIVAQPFLVANFYFWRESGYFDTSTEFQPLLHTWSLAVEEQFYLFFPLVMILAMRGGFGFTRLCVLVFIAGSFGWCLYATVHHPSSAFYLIFSRIWELDLGVLLALAPKRRFTSPRMDSVLGWLGLAAILAAVFGFSVNTPFPGWAALLPCLGAALLIYANSAANTPAARLLGWKPLVFVGRISYSLYLWHWPAIVLTKLWFLAGATVLPLSIAVLLSFLLAWLSYRYVETPFRKKRVCRGRRSLFAFAGASALLLVAAGALAYLGEGLPGRVPEEVRRHAKERSPYHQVKGMNQLVAEGTLPVFGSAGGKGALLLWGDSHAVSLLPVFDRMGKEHGVAVHAAVQPEIAPVAGAFTPHRRHHRPGYGDLVLEEVREQEIRQVVLAARWSIYAFGTPDGDKRWLLGDDTTTSPRDAEAVFERRLRETVGRLTDSGVGVWIVQEVGLQPFSVPETVALASMRGRDLNSLAVPAAGLLEKRKPVDSLIGRAVGGLPVTFLDPFPILTDASGNYRMAKDGVAVYSDRHHLSTHGANLLEPLLSPVFEAAAGNPP